MRQATGIVLAGGRSTRMGRDKASLPWGGGTLLEMVLARLVPVCTELIVVSNVPREAGQGVRIVPDSYVQCGPLAGIHAGLTTAACEYAFVVACDMPYLDTAAVRFSLEAAVGYDAAVPCIDGRYHPLHGVYRKTCLPLITKRLEEGRHRVQELYVSLCLRTITGEELACFDSELRMLRNWNTPEDMKGNRL